MGKLIHIRRGTLLPLKDSWLCEECPSPPPSLFRCLFEPLSYSLCFTVASSAALYIGSQYSSPTTTTVIFISRPWIKLGLLLLLLLFLHLRGVEGDRGGPRRQRGVVVVVDVVVAVVVALVSFPPFVARELIACSSSLKLRSRGDSDGDSDGPGGEEAAAPLQPSPRPPI